MEKTIARSEIIEVLHRYCILGKENCDWDALARCFEPDAAFRLPGGTVVKPNEISQVVSKGEANLNRHHITTIAITFKNSNEACSESLFMSITDVGYPDHWGKWKDIVRKQVDGSWLISDREIIMEGSNPKGWFAGLYGNS